MPPSRDAEHRSSTGSPPQQAWRPILDQRQARRARATALTVAQRIRALEPAQPTAAEKWHPISLARGDAGVALMCGYVDECVDDPSWAASAHTFLAKATMGAQHQVPFTAELFGGLAGLGYVATALSRNGTRYQRLLTAIDDAIATQLSTAWTERHQLSYVGDFDVVSGLAGIGTYLLQRASTHACTQSLYRVIELLLGPGENAPTPRQWCTSPHARSRHANLRFPRGDINCGLAHGVPGPLAFLALTKSAGFRPIGIDTAIEATASWLIDHRCHDNWGVNWPTHAPLDDADVIHLPTDTDESTAFARAAWCYGCPGVARALWLAGVAMNRRDWRDLAMDAMHGVYRRPADATRLSSPGLCHGVAGVLQITLRFHHDTGDDDLAHQARMLVEQLLDSYDPNSQLGFRNPNPNAFAGDASFLEGAAGVALALLAASTNIAPTWDRALLIA